MDCDYVMSVRGVRDSTFSTQIGSTRYLAVPLGDEPRPAHAIPAGAWFQRVQQAGEWSNDRGEPRGDILFVVHGYDMSEQEVIDRHRRLVRTLAALPRPFRGVVVSFDWPTENSALAYLADRHKARQTALRLVTDGIRPFSARQLPDCPVNLHLLGHSTGAYVIREAFDDADDMQLQNAAWNVSQICLIAADISSRSLAAGNPEGASLYTHCQRLTNYFSRHDNALDLSNVKRVGLAPRAGRTGLPRERPPQAVDVDCSEYFRQLLNNPALQRQDQPEGFVGERSHSWYFGNVPFTRDLFATLIGTDRDSIATRAVDADGRLRLAPA
jgi:esterase/lipase superfamily enzyme